MTVNGIRLTVLYLDSCPGDDRQAELCNNGKKTRDSGMRFLVEWGRAHCPLPVQGTTGRLRDSSMRFLADFYW